MGWGGAGGEPFHFLKPSQNVILHPVHLPLSLLIIVVLLLFFCISSVLVVSLSILMRISYKVIYYLPNSALAMCQVIGIQKSVILCENEINFTAVCWIILSLPLFFNFLSFN